ncbi:hypothetical protein [Pedobacter sp. L105]|uniref:hypothetical protein n=1 Tax=Pedobacter sp. L105 TaxID=1641871 RepID=UPI00131D2A00|nr:hypothetical protein [Pedobacter sp. L105]
MDTQNFEFLAEGNAATYKNIWRHTIAGIGYMAIVIFVLYFMGRPQWHTRLLVIISIWTIALLYSTYTGKFVTKILVDKLAGIVTVYYYNVNTGENSKIFNVRGSNISYKFEVSRSPAWRLILSDQEASFKLSTPSWPKNKNSRNTFTKENLDYLYQLLSIENKTNLV